MTIRPLESRVMAANRHSVFGRLGSVWVENTTQQARAEAKLMADAVQASASYISAASTYQLMTGQDIVLDWQPLHLNDQTVFAVQGDLATQLNELAVPAEGWVGVFSQPGGLYHPDWTTLFDHPDNLALATEYGQLLLFPDSEAQTTTQVNPLADLPTWLVSVPNNQTVLKIQRPDGGWMIRGVDFASEPGVVIMYEDPRALWPAQTTACTVRQRPYCPNSYTLQLDQITGRGQWVADYYRNRGGLQAFERAVAEASGLHVVNQAGSVLAKQVKPVGCTYILPEGEVWAWYPHTQLEVGQAVAVGLIIGEESLTITHTLSTLDVELDPRLFSPGSIYDRRARTFCLRERPLGLNLSITNGT